MPADIIKAANADKWLFFTLACILALGFEPWSWVGRSLAEAGGWLVLAVGLRVRGAVAGQPPAPAARLP